MRGPRKDWDDDCERDCYGTQSGKSFFWGIIIVIVGAYIIFEFVIKEVADLPKWLSDFEFCWVVWVIVGIAIVAAGLRTISRSGRHQ
jgi:hypothetical protein